MAVQGYTYSEYATIDSSFSLELIDPCMATSLIPELNLEQPVHSLVGFEEVSHIFPSYTDDVSLLYDLE